MEFGFGGIIVKKSKSFRRKILLWFLVGYTCIIGSLLSYSKYLSYSYGRSIRQTGNAMLNLYVSELNDILERNGTYLLKTVTQNVNAVILESPHVSTVKKYSSVYDLNQELGNQLTLEKGVAGFLTLYDHNAFCYYIFQKNVSFEDKEDIRRLASSFVQRKNLIGKWQIVRCKNKAYLILIYNIRGTCLSVAVDFKAVTSNIVAKYASSNTRIVFTDSYGTLYNGMDGIQAATAKRNGFNRLIGMESSIELSKKIENTDLTMNILIPNSRITTLQWSQIFIFCILFIAFGCALISYYYLHKELIKPFDQMIDTMNKIRDGQLDAKMLECSSVDEYEQTGKVFNAMMSQIKELQIKTYEDQIKEQKLKWQYLQLQIKPHFYLNGLKTLYALSQQKKYKESQNMIVAISKYLRYTFKETFQSVTLSEELSFTKDYIEMQKSCTGIQVSLEILMDESVANEIILPLTI